MTTRKPKAQTIKIGPMVYAVQDVERLQGAADQSLWGEIAYHRCEIRLEAGLSPQFKRVVLWHEIIHGILEHAGHRDDHDEELIDQLAYGIVQVLADNPSMRVLE